MLLAHSVAARGSSPGAVSRASRTAWSAARGVAVRVAMCRNVASGRAASRLRSTSSRSGPASEITWSKKASAGGVSRIERSLSSTATTQRCSICHSSSRMRPKRSCAARAPCAQSTSTTVAGCSARERMRWTTRSDVAPGGPPLSVPASEAASHPRSAGGPRRPSSSVAIAVTSSSTEYDGRSERCVARLYDPQPPARRVALIQARSVLAWARLDGYGGRFHTW